jgi:hypothetical protein
VWSVFRACLGAVELPRAIDSGKLSIIILKDYTQSFNYYTPINPSTKRALDNEIHS